MKARLSLIAGVLVLLLGILAYSATFTVHETEQAIVLQFGDPKQVITEPGLHFKLPFVQEVRTVEKRVLNLDPPSQTIILRDQLRLIVDAFMRYRITDALRFLQVAGSESTLQGTLGSIVNARAREVLGDASLAEVLSAQRAQLMADIRRQVNLEAARFGIEIVDLRIGRADLAPDVSESVYSRMRAERERDAADFRAQGQEQYQTITAQADREAIVIRAEANRQSEILRGQGDADRTRILNGAYSQDPEFFQFYRTMEAYRESLDPATSFLVLTTNSEFFKYFQDAQGLLWDEGTGVSGSGSLPGIGGTGATEEPAAAEGGTTQDGSAETNGGASGGTLD